MLKIKALISRAVSLPVAGVCRKDPVNSGGQREGGSPAAMPNVPGALGAGWQPEGEGLQRRVPEIPPERPRGCLRRAGRASLLENLSNMLLGNNSSYVGNAF